MKKKVVSIMILVAMIICAISTVVVATNTSNVQLQLVTDKSMYKKGDTIIVDVKVQSINGLNIIKNFQRICSI